MKKPVLIISDTHYHNFNLYAQVDKNGLNSRLNDTIRATVEAARRLREAGGKVIIHCGDVFHVRGDISPTVLNPVMDMYRMLINQGFEVYMISGNHDLETNDADYHASTATALEKVGVKVINKPTMYFIEGDAWVFVPWLSSLDKVREYIQTHPDMEPEDLYGQLNLVLHAPLNGVIEGLPDHGLSMKDFEGMPYNTVFCGHYHNHKVFHVPGTNQLAVSVGALTHQNWGDVDSRAGYILYDSGVIDQEETSAPKFYKVSVDDLLTFDHVVDNYIKVVDGDFESPAEIEAIRNDLILRGAKGVVVEGLVKRPAVTRGTTTGGAPTLQSILGDYIDRNYPGEDNVKALALEILGEVYD